jgi:hypothetical protein
VAAADSLTSTAPLTVATDPTTLSDECFRFLRFRSVLHPWTAKVQPLDMALGHSVPVLTATRVVETLTVSSPAAPHSVIPSEANAASIERSALCWQP